MRKWCVDCRRLVSLEQARQRKVVVVEPGGRALAEAE
jgi:hypothetical protein